MEDWKMPDLGEIKDELQGKIFSGEYAPGSKEFDSAMAAILHLEDNRRADEKAEREAEASRRDSERADARLEDERASRERESKFNWIKLGLEGGSLLFMSGGMIYLTKKAYVFDTTLDVKKNKTVAESLGNFVRLAGNFISGFVKK